MDLNKGVKGSTILLGYRSGYYNWEKIEKTTSDAAREKEIATQEEEAIYDIIVTRMEPYHPEGIISKGIYYYPVSDVSLNEGCRYGTELYMYYATRYYSKNYNSVNNASTILPDTVFSGYITRLGFAENERVPYTTLAVDMDDIKQAKSEGLFEDYLPWEYVMISGDKQRVDLNDGVVLCNGDYCTDSRISMFAQRVDMSVKAAGEITGGFIESTYDVGDVYIKK